ncbi:MAG: DNA-3-methyladenine glycosylase [Bryobacteraceae bacterium]
MQKALRHLTTSDPVLGRIIETIGPYSIEFRDPCFDTLVRSIVYQQLSGKAAATIFGRLAATSAEGQVTPGGILKLRPSRMRKLGLSGQKTIYIRDLARHTLNGGIVLDDLPGLPDEDVIEHLTRVKGIGVWTAQMFLIFALRRLNVLAVNDLGVQTAIRKAYGLDELPKPAQVERLGQSWQPYCSVACWYLWRSLEGQAAL